MTNISVIIVAKGNPPHILETIKSVEDLAAEIIIADIGIEKSLLNELKTYKKITVKTIEENVPYVELIREKLKKLAKNDYVFFLDPDEIVPPALSTFIRESPSHFDYFKISRKNIIFGKWIQHARWWPDYQIRLFKKDAVTWPTLIHHQPEPHGKELTIDPREDLALVHYNYENIDEYLSKMYRYAKAEAKEMVTNESEFSLGHAVKKALSEFMSRFFADKGYRDGTHGFVLSVLQMFNYFLIYMYYWELKGRLEAKPEALVQDMQKFFQQGFTETNHWASKEKFTHGIQAIKMKVVNKLLP